MITELAILTVDHCMWQDRFLKQISKVFKKDAKDTARQPGRQYIPRENDINQWDIYEQDEDGVSNGNCTIYNLHHFTFRQLQTNIQPIQIRSICLLNIQHF